MTTTENLPVLGQITVYKPDEDLEATAHVALNAAENFKIESVQDYEFAATAMLQAKARWNELKKRHTKLKAPVLVLGKEIDALFKQALEYLEQTEREYKAHMVHWKNAQDALAEQQRQEQFKAQREAEAAALAATKAAEAAAQAAAAARAKPADDQAPTISRAEQLAATKAEMRALQAAQLARVQAIEASALPVPTTAAPKVAGVTYATVWDFEIVDLEQINPAFIVKTAKAAEIRKLVTSLKNPEQVQKIVGTGVRVFSTQQPRGSA